VLEEVDVGMQWFPEQEKEGNTSEGIKHIIFSFSLPFISFSSIASDIEIHFPEMAIKIGAEFVMQIPSPCINCRPTNTVCAYSTEIWAKGIYPSESK
jgi:hypothetical protein